MTDPGVQLPEPDREPEATCLDLALRGGAERDLAVVRERLAADPLAAVEYAETVQFLERMRALTVVPDGGFAGRLHLLARAQADRLALRRPQVFPWRVVAAMAAAAAVLFVLLAIVDPLSLRRGGPESERAVASAEHVVPQATPERPSEEALGADLAQAIEYGERLTRGTTLAQAWSRFRSASPTDRLSQWLSPRNALAVLRLDQELRSTADLRRQALRNRGQLPEVEDRVQRLARELAGELLAAPEADLDGIAVTTRALLAAGGSEVAAIQRGEALLMAMLPQLEGGKLARALLALGEIAIATGRDLDAVYEHGRRLVGEVTVADDVNWQRRRPRLLARTTSAIEVAEAGRFLRIAPAFGIRADEALLVRLLLAADLQERLRDRSDGPEVPIALVFGFADLLPVSEREEVEARLRVWRPTTLMPDYLLLHQLAATRAPCHSGYARFQLDLRRIGAVATPMSWCDRAALCLCLSAAFAPGELAPPIFG